MTTDWNIGDLLGTSSSYWKGCTLHAGVRLDIFSQLDKASMTCHELCNSLQSDHRGTVLLLNALTGMGLLSKTGQKYSTTPFSAKYLSRNSPTYMGHILLHHHHLIDGWAQLDQAVTTGKPISRRSYGEKLERESFIMGMYNIAMNLAPIVAERLDLAKRKKLLDLGGGPGTYAIHFCLANPGLTSIIYDRPTTRPFAEKTVNDFNLSAVIDFHPGDFITDPLPEEPFDVAWLSHILHSNSPKTCQTIISKTLAALEPGGIVFIHDFILDHDRTSPEYGALFALNMLINNPGRTYSEQEIGAMLKKGGAKKVARHSYEGPNESRIVYGIV